MLVIRRVPFGRSKQSVSGSFPLPEDWDLKHHDDCPAVRWGDDGIPWYTSWWFQPLWTNISQIGSFTQGSGMKIKTYLSCHHLVYHGMIWYEWKNLLKKKQEAVSPGFFLWNFANSYVLHMFLVRCCGVPAVQNVRIFSMQQSWHLENSTRKSHHRNKSKSGRVSHQHAFSQTYMVHLKCQSFFCEGCLT